MSKHIYTITVADPVSDHEYEYQIEASSRLEASHIAQDWSNEQFGLHPCPVPPCPEGVPYDNHLVDCNCD